MYTRLQNPTFLQTKQHYNTTSRMSNRCVHCKMDLGPYNARQYCDKTHCLNEKDEFLETTTAAESKAKGKDDKEPKAEPQPEPEPEPEPWMDVDADCTAYLNFKKGYIAFWERPYETEENKAPFFRQV